MGKTVNILWTGGWDSTFRLCELSMMDVIIQPIYVNDKSRKSTDNELKAMDKILNALMKKDKTVAIINPIITVNKEEIPQNEEITKAYNKIHKATNLGVQHDWLARLAVSYPGIEIGTEAGNAQTSHIINAIQTFGKLKKTDDVYILDPDNSTQEGILVFGNLHFPIIDKTEKDMLQKVKEMHYEDVMDLIWFCHSPTKNADDEIVPCGICHPCQVKISSGMEFLFSEDTLKRGIKYKKVSGLLGERITNKLFSIKKR